MTGARLVVFVLGVFVIAVGVMFMPFNNDVKKSIGALLQQLVGFGLIAFAYLVMT